MITQKICYSYTFTFLCKLERYFFCIKFKYFEKIDFFYYIQHQLINFPNANQNKIFNWIKVKSLHFIPKYRT